MKKELAERLFLSKRPLGGERFFNTAGGIGCEAGAFGIVEGVDGFDEADGTDGNQIVLVANGAVILLDDVGDKAEVVLNQLIAGIHIAVQTIGLEIAAFLVNRQGAGEGAGIDDM